MTQSVTTLERTDSLIESVAYMASLREQVANLQRQVNRIEAVSDEQLNNFLIAQRETEARITALTDAKFVTYRTLIDSQAEKVALALSATEKAIGKAEIATDKAIEKESLANNDRFAKVNEFRAQQTELIARFATLERVDLLYSQSRQRTEEINNNLQDRIGDLSTRITELATRLTKIEEFARGAQGNKIGIYAAIGAAVGLIAIIVFISNMLGR